MGIGPNSQFQEKIQINSHLNKNKNIRKDKKSILKYIFINIYSYKIFNDNS